MIVRRSRTPLRIWLLALAMLIVPLAGQSQTEPTISFDTLLAHLRLDSTTHVLSFSGEVEALFLPPGADQSVKAELLYENNPVARYSFDPMRAKPPFSKLSSRTIEALQGETKHSGYLVTRPGDYTLVFSYGDDEVFFRFPFEIMSLNSGSEYDPQTYMFVSGPWQEWVFIQYQADFPDAGISLGLYKQLQSAEARRRDLDLDGAIECNGEEVGSLSKNAMLGTNRGRLQAYLKQFSYQPEGKDYRESLPFSEFANHNGTCELQLIIGDEETRIFPFEVAGGKFVGKQREGGPMKFFIKAE